MATVKRPRRVILSLALALGSLMALAFSIRASAFPLSGVIKDSAGTTLKRIRVTIFDDDGIVNPRDELAVVYTDETGHYSAELAGGWGAEPAPDIYIVIDWHFALLHGPGAVYLPHEVVFKGVSESEGNTRLFQEERSPIKSDWNPSQPLEINLNTTNSEPNLDVLRQRINEIISFYTEQAATGNVSWNFDYDIPATILTWHDSFANGQEIFIARNDVLGGPRDDRMKDGNTVDIYHEVGHVIHYHFHGGFPSTTYEGDHSVITESDPSYALIESWPSFMATLAADANGITNETKHKAVLDPNCTNWRGDEKVGDAYRRTGYENGHFESGEIVEGALGGVFFELSNQGTAVGPVFKTMVTGKPNNIAEFIGNFIAQGGDAALAYRALYTHGIPFARVRFKDGGFQVDEPSDAAGSPGEGNVKIIDNKIFLRGKVPVGFDALANTDLGIQNTLPLDNVKIGFKVAAAEMVGRVNFSEFTPTSSFSQGEIALDTTQLGTTRGDGEWDLVIVGATAGGLLDALLPFWEGDATPEVDMDEKYLKKVGTWYDKDKDPATEPDGKVIVDNTAPKVENFKPRP